MTNCNELSNEPILYELLEYFVRKLEPELIKCKNDGVILPTTGTIKNALRYLNNRYSLPESISEQVSLTLPWKFAIGDHGRLLAVLQENIIEIRKAKDEYSSIVGKASVPKDAFPQWRKFSWSPDGTILILASSNGYTSFYNALGNNIFSITPKTVSQNPNILEAGDAIASMIFLKPRIKTERWSYEFLLITYSGLLRSYHISATNGFETNYEFSFGNFYKNGINAVTYDEKHDLFYVSGNAITQKIMSTASESGLTSWRPLNDYPYCKLSFTFEEHTKGASRFSIWNIIPSFSFQSESIIFKIAISPNSDHLACLHTDGSLSLWGLPNLVLKKKWKLSEQPDYNIPNPLGHIKSKKFPTGVTEFHPLDIGWWSDQAIIIARYSGSTSVCSIKNLKNLLGTSPEFLAGQPQICELGLDRGFLCLDCETFITSKKRNRESNTEGQVSEASSESEKEDDELEPVTILNYTANLMQSTLYSITDIERFQPKRKKSRVLFRTYRILGLKSTTPEELYSRKIDIEEYEEALTLANTYNLDTDLVYQTQWRKSELSLSAIQEHLSKVTKRSWVLHECVTRVPDTIEAARELLNFGLKGANLETLIAIGVCDNGKFIIETTEEEWENVDDASVSLKQVQKVNELLEKLDIQNLSDAQKDLIKYRKKLLDHLDKLLTYEIILEPSMKYDKKFYEEFRQVSAVENAIRFAKRGDFRSVEIMFTYYGEYLLPHWLAVISFFPETLNPIAYKKLLPECDTDKQLFLPDQRELRQKDWSENKIFSEIINLEDEDKSQLLYESDSALSIYRNTELTPEVLTQWYKSRAYQIERNSFIVDNALQLIEIAKSHNISGLDELLLDLKTLDDLVYKVYLEDLSLDQLEKLSNLEKIKLLMSISDEKSFVDDIKAFLLPFIRRQQQYLGGELNKELFSNYLIYVSKEDLKLPVKLFEYLKQTHDLEIFQVIDDIATLALDCIYACNDLDMYSKAKHILDSIAKDRDGKRSSAVTALLEELDRELECAKILNKYEVKTTLNYLHKNKNNPDDAQLLLIQMGRSLHEVFPSPDEKLWAQLLNEMLDVHGLLFACVDVEICFEICVSARLVSGIKSNIQNCAALIETKKNEQSLLKVSYEKAVNLILEASKEYFNSSKSLTDPSMELAKACLHLIVDDNPKIKEEYDLINALQILSEFNVDILPLQVRLTQDKLKLIEDCLHRREGAHKSRQRLLTLANYLRIEGNNNRVREGKVLELITKKALQVKDYNVCASACLQLMENNYIPAWRVALDLGYCEDYEDLKVRQKCLWFAINYGPSEILNGALDRVHLIRIQVLHKNLELWIPNEPEDLKDDSEDEFTDAMTTPQVEAKEFVPKMLETSTEIVKTSANIVKKSTFGLINNISDANFWKSGLKFNFGIESENEPQGENEEQEDVNQQSFPCFYESLHESYRLSNIDTGYVNYSVPDIQNTRLKCCRAFLRIAMLNDSSCYGLEVTDVNHLLLECAKYTMPDDWLLGVAYLFSLKKDRITNAQSIFTDLPQTKLYIQTAAYLYALELHKMLYTDFENLYLYDPIDLIKKTIITAENSQDCDIKKKFNYWQEQMLSKHERRNEQKSFDEYDMSETKENEEKLNDEINTESIGSTKSDLEKSSTSNVKEDAEWTDDWGDFSDEDAVVSSNYSKDTTKNYLQVEESLVQNLGECATEKDRFEAFEEAYAKIQNLDHFHQVKKLLIQWPEFTEPAYITVEKHPILRMIKTMNTHATKTKANSPRSRTLREYEELLNRVSSNVLKEFLREEAGQIPVEDEIYLRLCLDDPVYQQEAVTIIKDKYKNLTLPEQILEKVFERNLTALFSPQHEFYNRVIDHIFTNRASSEIRDNAEILMRELKNQNHISSALRLIKLIEEIPETLCTFDTCYQLLMRK